MTKILVCNPTYYGVNYEINPWMSVQNQPDTKLAFKQWERLLKRITWAGGDVRQMSPRPNLPDIVFTANAGICFGRTVVLSNFKHPERQGERAVYKEWFEAHGYHIEEEVIPAGGFFEVAGDALFGSSLDGFGEKSIPTLFLGYGFRSDYKTVTSANWNKVFHGNLYYLELVDPYFYHLDTCFCPLQSDFALIYPGAFDPDTIRRLADNGLELLKVPEEDARKFACNAVCIGNRVVIPSGCEATKQLLLRAGFEVADTDMSEFIKAGGACKCLTLSLPL